MNTNIHALRSQEHGMDPEDRTPIVYIDPTGRKVIGTSASPNIYKLIYAARDASYTLEDRGDHFTETAPDGTTIQIGPTGRYR